MMALTEKDIGLLFELLDFELKETQCFFERSDAVEIKRQLLAIKDKLDQEDLRLKAERYGSSNQ